MPVLFAMFAEVSTPCATVLKHMTPGRAGGEGGRGLDLLVRPRIVTAWYRAWYRTETKYKTETKLGPDSATLFRISGQNTNASSIVRSSAAPSRARRRKLRLTEATAQVGREGGRHGPREGRGHDPKQLRHSVARWWRRWDRRRRRQGGYGWPRK